MHTRPLWPRAMDDDGAPVDYSYVASVSEGEKKRAEEMSALRTRQEAGAVLRRQPRPVTPPVDEYGTRARRALPQEDEASPSGYNRAWKPAVRARVSGADVPAEPVQRVTSLGDAVRKDPFQVPVRRVSDDGEVSPVYSGYQRVDEPAAPSPSPAPEPEPQAPPEPAPAPPRALEDMPEWYRVAQQNNLPGVEQYHEETHRTGYRDRDGRISGPESAQRHNPYQHLTGNRAAVPDAPRAFGGAQVVASGTRQDRARQLASGRRTALPQERRMAQEAAMPSAPQGSGMGDAARSPAAEAFRPVPEENGYAAHEPEPAAPPRRMRRAVAYAPQPMPEDADDGLDAWRQPDESAYAVQDGPAQGYVRAAPRRPVDPYAAQDVSRAGDGFAAPPRQTAGYARPLQPAPVQEDASSAYASPAYVRAAPPRQAGGYAPAQGYVRPAPSRQAPGYAPAQAGAPQGYAPVSAYPPQGGYTPPAPQTPDAAEEEPPRRLNIPWAGIAVSVMALLLVAVWIMGMNFRTQTDQVLQQRLLDRETLLQRYELSYQSVIEQECQRYNLHPAFVAAIVRTESHFDPSATSSKGARGLMQLMNDTYEWIHDKLEDPAEKSFDRMYDAETNLRYGCWYINFLSELFRGDPVCVAAAYHTGQNWMKNILGNSSYSSDGLTIQIDKIPDESTRDYARKVVDAYAVFKQKYYAATQW